MAVWVDETQAPGVQVGRLQAAAQLGKAGWMVDKRQPAAPLQQTVSGLYDLAKCYRHFVARNGLFGIRVESPAPHRTVRRVTHYRGEPRGSQA